MIKIGVGALVMDEHDRLVLVKHGYKSYWYGTWILPGGMLEPGETLKDCARREVKEETGLDVDIGEHLITFERLVNKEDKLQLHVVYIDFWARCKSSPPDLTPGDDVSEAIWVPVNELYRYYNDLHPDARVILGKAGLLGQVGRVVDTSTGCGKWGSEVCSGR